MSRTAPAAWDDDVFVGVSVFSGEKKAVWVRLFALCGKMDA